MKLRSLLTSKGNWVPANSDTDNYEWVVEYGPGIYIVSNTGLEHNTMIYREEHIAKEEPELKKEYQEDQPDKRPLYKKVDIFYNGSQHTLKEVTRVERFEEGYEFTQSGGEVFTVEFAPGLMVYIQDQTEEEEEEES